MRALTPEGDSRMMQQVLSPGMQYGEETDFRAAVLRVPCDGGERFRRGPKQDVVNLFPVVICDARDRFGHGENHVKVFGRQQLRLARFHPFRPRRRKPRATKENSVSSGNWRNCTIPLSSCAVWSR